MSRILKMKHWLEISEAAEHLTKHWNENVSEKDVFQLALDRHLKLGVSTLGITFARELIILEDGKIELGEEVTLPSGEWEFPMIGGNPDLIRFMKSHAMFAEPPKDKSLILENGHGQKFSPTEINQNFQFHQAYRLPEGSSIVVKKEDLLNLIKDNREAELATCQNNIVNLDNLPKEIQLAISVYYEFWDKKPENTKPATDATVMIFLTKKLGVKLSDASFNRITTIARPEKAKKGGAPKTELREYKGKSQEK